MILPCFVANWKMHKTGPEAVRYLEILQKQRPACRGQAQIILAPPYTALFPVSESVTASALKIDLAAQNIYFKEEGAYTGEISATMVYEAGCRYLIVGHSERRAYFHETDQEVAQKVKQARKIGLKPILCVGETIQQREENKTVAVVLDQVRQGFSLDSAENRDFSECLIAYEPVWAIGTGKTPFPEDVEHVHGEIERYLVSEGVEQRPRLLYGGSVNEQNVGSFMKEPHVDGVLVGSASLSAEIFSKMIEHGCRAKEK